ncbi:hypothetical protein [Streptacidiphilus sp. ASG 303]|uniref:hypothetical protein n=1 Tax=Streptacidiphilus sp. ASG 303 TaxID=2896847 RepID=UPI0035B469C8
MSTIQSADEGADPAAPLKSSLQVSVQPEGAGGRWRMPRGGSRQHRGCGEQ